MIDESCRVPRENLDDGFNPCRRQVVENGELCQYAHMYDVMNERYDREDETSYLDRVKRDKITSTTPVLLAGNNTQIYANSTNGEGRVNMLPSAAFNNPENHTEASIPSAKAVADYVTANISVLETEIAAAFENRIADAVADNGLLPTNALMMDYVDGSLINYNSITVSGGGTSNLVYNRVRFKNNRIYGDCDFTVNSEGDAGGVTVNIKINGTDINIPPVFTKFILSNKPMLVHKSSNTIIEGKNIYNITDGTVYIQFNIGDFNTGEFIFIVDSVFTGYNQPM